MKTKSIHEQKIWEEPREGEDRKFKPIKIELFIDCVYDLSPQDVHYFNTLKFKG